jgi:hypothetical protein
MVDIARIARVVSSTELGVRTAAVGGFCLRTDLVVKVEIGGFWYLYGRSNALGCGAQFACASVYTHLSMPAQIDLSKENGK